MIKLNYRMEISKINNYHLLVCTHIIIISILIMSF